MKQRPTCDLHECAKPADVEHKGYTYCAAHYRQVVGR